MAGVQSSVDRVFTYAINLERFNASTARWVEWFLIDLQNDLRGAIVEADIPGRATSRQQRRLAALFEQTSSTIDETYTGINARHKSDLRELASIANIEATKAINVGLTVDIARPTLTREDLIALSKDPIIRGRPASQWWAGQSDDLTKRFQTEMRLGIAEGQTNQELVTRVIGKAGKRTVTVHPKTGKRSVKVQYNGGIMDKSRREAMALVRTSAQSVSNDSAFQTYQANSKLLRGVSALVTLDGRTTIICMSRSGGVWNIDTGEPLPESTRQEALPPPPPWHWNCRSFLVPVTKSWDELREAAGKDKLPAADRKKLDTVPKKERRAIDGKVPGSMNMDQWLKERRTDKQQREHLGPGRWKLWKDGDIRMDQLTDFSGRELTLRELRKIADKG